MHLLKLFPEDRSLSRKVVVSEFYDEIVRHSLNIRDIFRCNVVICFSIGESLLGSRISAILAGVHGTERRTAAAAEPAHRTAHLTHQLFGNSWMWCGNCDICLIG